MQQGNGNVKIKEMSKKGRVEIFIYIFKNKSIQKAVNNCE